MCEMWAGVSVVDICMYLYVAIDTFLPFCSRHCCVLGVFMMGWQFVPSQCSFHLHCPPSISHSWRKLAGVVGGFTDNLWIGGVGMSCSWVVEVYRVVCMSIRLIGCWWFAFSLVGWLESQSMNRRIYVKAFSWVNKLLMIKNLGSRRWLFERARWVCPAWVEVDSGVETNLRLALIRVLDGYIPAGGQEYRWARRVCRSSDRRIHI